MAERLSGAEFRQLVDLIRRYGDEMDQWAAFRVTTPAGYEVFVNISMGPLPEHNPDMYDSVDHIVGDPE